MKKFFYKIALATLAFALFATSSVHASANKFYITALIPQGGTDMAAMFAPYDGTNIYGNEAATWTVTNFSDEKQFWADARTAIAAWGVANGYPGSVASDVLNFAPNLNTVAYSGLASNLTTDSTHRLTTDAEKSTWNGKGSGSVTSIGLSSTDFSVSGGPITSSGSITANLNTSGITAGTYSGLTVNNKGIATAGTTRSWNNTPGRSIVTGTGATGFQPSSTRDTNVKYGVKVTSTASIASGQEGYVTLEIAPTNSATPSDWVNVGATCGNGQTYSLAVALQGIQPTYCQISTNVPAGWYAKLRSVNVTGTPAYTYLGGQEMSL